MFLAFKSSVLRRVTKHVEFVIWTSNLNSSAFDKVYRKCLCVVFLETFRQKPLLSRKFPETNNTTIKHFLLTLSNVIQFKVLHNSNLLLI